MTGLDAVHDWAERARRAQAAIDATTGAHMAGQKITVITDQKDADATYPDSAARTENGTLVITSGGRPVAWYAAGKWIKVEFA